MKKLICSILCFQMMAFPVAANARAAQGEGAAPGVSSPAVSSNVMLRLIRREVAANPAFYYAEEELTSEGAAENKVIALSGLQEIQERLADSSYTLESIRADLVRQAVAEEEGQLVELKFVIDRMAPETLDQLFAEAMQKGVYDASLRQQYESAWTAAEKRTVLLELVRSDLYQVKSLTLKRLGLLDRDALARELSLMKSLLNTKGKDKWKTVLVVVLGVAAAGFVSWAIISSTKKYWEKRTADLEKDAKNRDEATRQDYAQREADLQAMYQQRDALRDQGYVWSVCHTTQRTTTAACSYDGMTHTGSEVCITQCMKNFTTGDEQLPQTSCSSAYIPSNCSLPNPYNSGYNDGWNSGYDDGYTDGYDSAYRDAYDDYYKQGYDAGYLKGYDYGYSDGFTDGLAQAEYDDSQPVAESLSVMSSSTGDSVASGYKTGYREGYATATTLRVGR